jgi:hypothetical protein
MVTVMAVAGQARDETGPYVAVNAANWAMPGAHSVTS